MACCLRKFATIGVCGAARDPIGIVASSQPPPTTNNGIISATMATADAPVPFEVYRPDVYLHGTKADLAPGDLLMPGRESNFEPGRVMNYIYFTATLDAATWGAELAAGDGPGRIYIVEPTGEFEDDPNVTDKRFPGNPTQSFRSRDPLRVIGEVKDWIGHPPAALAAMRQGVAAAQRRGPSAIDD